MKKTMKRPKAIQKPIVPILSNPKQLLRQIDELGEGIWISTTSGHHI